MKQNYLKYAKKKKSKLTESIENSLTEDHTFNVSEAEKEIQLLITEKESINKGLEKLTLDKDTSQNILNELNEWIESRSNSYSWKVFSAMNSRLELARLDSQKAVFEAESITVPDLTILLAIRKKFVRSLNFFTLLIIATFGLITLLSNYFPELKSIPFISSIFALNDLQRTLIFILFFIFIFIILIINYYRSWSEFARSLNLLLAKLEWAKSATIKSRSEVIRLQSLYKQVKSWLELISITLHHPWEIDQRWIDQTSTSINKEKFPFSVRIAQAEEGDFASTSNLHRSSAARKLKKGWRLESYKEQVNQVAHFIGMSPEQFNVDVLDSDLPEAANNTRFLMREHILNSKIQENLGKKSLKKLAFEVQTELLSQAKPPVREYGDDPLQPLKVEDILSDNSDLMEWDEFLLEIASTNSELIPPMSVMPYSASGQTEGYHQNPKTYLLMPDRIQQNDFKKSDQLILKTYKDDHKKPMDLIVRVDLAGPISSDHIKLWFRSQLEENFELKNLEDDPKNTGV